MAIYCINKSNVLSYREYNKIKIEGRFGAGYIESLAHCRLIFLAVKSMTHFSRGNINQKQVHGHSWLKNSCHLKHGCSYIGLHWCFPCFPWLMNSILPVSQDLLENAVNFLVYSFLHRMKQCFCRLELSCFWMHYAFVSNL